MKRVLLVPVMAAGLVAAPVQAETSVTLYGVVDSGYGYEQFRFKGSGDRARATRSGLNDGYLKSNRWGIKGSEELGRGTRLIFQLEQGFSLNTGQAAKDHLAFSRKAIVGLSSDDWGTLTVGRQKPLGTDFLKLDTTKSMGKSSKAFGARGSRTDKLAKYISPEFGGLTAGVAYATNGSVEYDSGSGLYEQVDRDYLLSVGLRYARGPLTLAGVYDREHGNKDGHRRGYHINNWALAASYDFDVVEVNLAYGQDRHGKLKSPGNVGSKPFGSAYSVTGLGDYNQKGFKSHNYMVSLSAPLGPGKLGVSWTRSSSNLDDVYAKANPGKQLSTRTQNIFAAMYTYPVSKRTTLYAYGSHGNGLAYIDGLKGQEAGVGLNHAF